MTDSKNPVFTRPNQRLLRKSRTQKSLGWGLIALVGLFGLTINSQAEEEKEEGKAAVTAKAEIFTCAEEPKKIGDAKLVEKPSEEGIKIISVTIELKDSGLTKGKHGVHIHEAANCQPCTAAKGHFDPGPYSQSSPDGNHPFHLGDLPNIEVDETGSGVLKTKTTRVTLSKGPLSIFDDNGSAFIIHVNEDTYCPEGEVAGCAGGGRAACGIIEQGT